MTMPSITKRELAWSYPDESGRAFVLRDDAGPIGWLRFKAESEARTVADWGGQRWTFERRGLLHATVTIREEGWSDPVAVFTPGPSGGVAAFSTGQHYTWAREHLWSGTWCFRSQDDRSAVCVSQQPGPLTAGAKVTIHSALADSPQAPVLVLLAWYLRVLEFEKLSESIVLCG